MLIWSSKAHTASVCCTCCWQDCIWKSCDLNSMHCCIHAAPDSVWGCPVTTVLGFGLSPSKELHPRRPAEHRPRGFAQAVNNHRSRLLSHCSLVMAAFPMTPPLHHHKCSSILHHSPSPFWVQQRESLPSPDLSQSRSQKYSLVVNYSSIYCIYVALGLHNTHSLNNWHDWKLNRPVLMGQPCSCVMCIGKTKRPAE